MRFPHIARALSALVVIALPLQAQTITNESIDRFIAGRNAEGPELAKVAEQTKELDKKIKDFRDCFNGLRELGQVTGTSASGFKAKAITRAKCGATSDDGFIEDRQKLLDNPEAVGASAAGMSKEDYAHFKERATGFLGGDRNFPEGELKALTARAADLSNALGVAYARGGGRETRGTGVGGMVGE